MALKTRDILVRQRSQIINALRGHLMEYGIVAPPGRSFVTQLSEKIERPDNGLPAGGALLCQLHLDQMDGCTTRIAKLERHLQEIAKADPEIVRLQTAPGVGFPSACTIKAFAPPLEEFKRGRDFAAWLGLVPVQKSTGRRTRLGRSSKIGQRDIRRLFIIGAMSRIGWAVRKGAEAGSWLANMFERKPRMLVVLRWPTRWREHFGR